MKNKSDSIFPDSNSSILEVFEKFYFEYHGRLVLYANKYLHDMDLARDVVQETFYTLWQLSDTSLLTKAYLFKTVRNKSLNLIRYNNYRQTDLNDLDQALQFIEQQQISNNDNPFNSLLELELENKLNELLEKLPKGCRQVFLMSRNDGLKNREIADKLQISLKMVEKQISKALLYLKNELSDYLIPLLIIFFG